MPKHEYEELKLNKNPSKDFRTQRPQPKINIIDACLDKNLFREWFGDLDMWRNWLAFLRVMFALPLSDEDMELYKQCTGRTELPERPYDEAWLIVGRRGGKALHIDTPIPTPQGYRRMGDLQPGDKVYGPDGKTTEIVAATPVMHNRPCYRIRFDAGDDIIADANHEWVTQTRYDRRNKNRRKKEIDPGKWPAVNLGEHGTDRTGEQYGKLTAIRPVQKNKEGRFKWLCVCECGRYTITRLPKQDISACSVCNNYRGNPDFGAKNRTTEDIYHSQEQRHTVPVPNPAQHRTRVLDIPPYVLGVWLGDGSSACGDITSMDEDIIQRVIDTGYTVGVTNSGGSALAAAQRYSVYGLVSQLGALGLLKNKHIPQEYLTASEEQRRELLHGLMDTDGWTAGKGHAQFTTIHGKLAEGLRFLLGSLGIKSGTKTYEYDSVRGRRTVYQITFRSDDAFSLARKKHAANDEGGQWFRSRHYIREVTPVEPQPVRCIQVAREDGLFCAGYEWRTTHNSRVLALIAVFLACFYDWRPYLSPGERATVICVASDRKQARIIFRYIEAFIKRVPLLKKLLHRDTMEQFELRGQVNIEIHTASFRSLRGYAICAALLDEMAFWRSEDTSNPDYEILEALRPGMSSIPGSMLLAASSPYSRKGELWNHYNKYFGQNRDDMLVWKAPTWVMNPTIPDSVIEGAYERDPARAAAEYGADFRTDVETFLTHEALEQVIVPNRLELPYLSDHEYFAFVDPSGGSNDSFTIAIAHEENGMIVVDVVRETKPPFSPEGVVADYAALCRMYNVANVRGDRYGGEWPREQFEKHDINYEVCKKPKSDLYRDMLPQVNSAQVALPDYQKMRQQLLGLERRTARGGRDQIDHGPGMHDDLANVVAGVIDTLDMTASVDIW